MAKIRHIALTTENPGEVAEFYKAAFDLEEIRRSDNGAVFLSDGYINLAILNWKTEKDADVGPNGPNYNGIHHIGFQVDDLDQACEQLNKVNGKQLNSREGPDGQDNQKCADQHSGHRHIAISPGNITGFPPAGQ